MGRCIAAVPAGTTAAAAQGRELPEAPWHASGVHDSDNQPCFGDDDDDDDDDV